MIRAISAKAAYNLDQTLFTKYAFSLEQLMELAGLCVAICSDRTAKSGSKILVCAGPGNNGGDGLVAGRHLVHFGRQVDLFWVQRSFEPKFYKIERILIPRLVLSGSDDP